jgi:hypothetical protein
MKLVRVRECDGACCKASPRWPTKDGKSCVFLSQDNLCKIKLNPELLPREPSPVYPNRSSKETFQETCVDWPQKGVQSIGQTDECCLQWVSDDG